MRGWFGTAVALAIALPGAGHAAPVTEKSTCADLLRVTIASRPTTILQAYAVIRGFMDGMDEAHVRRGWPSLLRYLPAQDSGRFVWDVRDVCRTRPRTEAVQHATWMLFEGAYAMFIEGIQRPSIHGGH